MGGTSGECNIVILWKDNFSELANSVGSTDNLDQAMNALRTMSGRNDVMSGHNAVINVHELWQIVRGLTNKMAVGNDGIQS